MNFSKIGRKTHPKRKRKTKKFKKKRHSGRPSNCWSSRFFSNLKPTIRGSFWLGKNNKIRIFGLGKNGILSSNNSIPTWMKTI